MIYDLDHRRYSDRELIWLSNFVDDPEGEALRFKAAGLRNTEIARRQETSPVNIRRRLHVAIHKATRRAIDMRTIISVGRDPFEIGKAFPPDAANWDFQI